MEHIATFFRMGGHAAYVWPALGLTAAILVGVAIASMSRMRDAERTLDDAETRFGRRRAGADRD
jgi:heme exporter protein D